MVAFTIALVGLMAYGRRLTRVDGRVLIVRYVGLSSFSFRDRGGRAQDRISGLRWRSVLLIARDRRLAEQARDPT